MHDTGQNPVVASSIGKTQHTQVSKVGGGGALRMGGESSTSLALDIAANRATRIVGRPRRRIFRW